MTEQINGWSVTTLKEYVERILSDHDRRQVDAIKALDQRLTQRMDLADKAVASALAGMDKATILLEAQASKWRDSSNEWRDAMDDRERTFATKDTVNLQIQPIAKEVAELRSWRDSLAGQLMGAKESDRDQQSRVRDSATYAYYIFATVAAVVAIIIAHFLH